MATATNTTLGEIRLAGDLAGSNNGLAPELTATGVTPGSYTLPSVTIDAKGRITAATSTNLSTALPTATSSQLGVARPDNSTIQIDGTGKLSANISIASYGVAGICRPDSTTISIDGSGVISARQATSTLNGIARPDNSTITVDGSGVISAPAIKATSSTLGAVKPDNSTITVDANGTITSTITASTVATTSSAGIVRPDNTTIAIDGTGVISLIAAPSTPIATSSSAGRVKPDNTTIQVDVAGTISGKPATSTSAGVVSIDTSSGLSVTDGVLSLAANVAKVNSNNTFTKMIKSTLTVQTIAAGSTTTVTGLESNVYQFKLSTSAPNGAASINMSGKSLGAEYTVVLDVTTTTSNGYIVNVFGNSVSFPGNTTRYHVSKYVVIRKADGTDQLVNIGNWVVTP